MGKVFSVVDGYLRALWGRYGLPGVVVGVLLALLALVVVAALAWWLEVDVVELAGL